MAEKIRFMFLTALLSIIPTILIWLPFFLRLPQFWTIPLPKDGMATIVSNYDGPLFLVVAKTFYDPSLISKFSFNLPSSYYAAHFPLYPILIRIFAPITGYPYSMLLVTVISSIFSIFMFNKLSKEFVSEKDALWLTFIFSVFPARWLIVRSVGSAEPLFVSFIIASIYYFRKRSYIWAGIFGFIAQLIKSPAILLFFTYLLIIISPYLKQKTLGFFPKLSEKTTLKRFVPIILMPLSLMLVFFIYKLRLNDFWAYFHSGDNIHLFFPPFQIFNYSQPWVGTFWLEEVIFVYLIGAYGVLKLFQMKESVISWFSAIFFLSLIFVTHRDIIRYSLPIVPFLLIAYKDVLINKEFKYIFIFLLIPIYLFSLAYISQNVMQISDWSPFL